MAIQNDPQSGYSNLSGKAPEPEEPDDEAGLGADPSDLAAQGNEHAAGEADKDRQHEAEQNDLDRKHKEKLAAASA